VYNQNIFDYHYYKAISNTGIKAGELFEVEGTEQVRNAASCVDFTRVPITVSLDYVQYN